MCINVKFNLEWWKSCILKTSTHVALFSYYHRFFTKKTTTYIESQLQPEIVLVFAFFPHVLCNSPDHVLFKFNSSSFSRTCGDCTFHLSRALRVMTRQSVSEARALWVMARQSASQAKRRSGRPFCEN